MNFRSDISFLRAFSVIAVVLYHFKFAFFNGGFIGVDIFFVISGYLMTRIVLSNFEKNNFKLLEFYQKRVVRIFPALLVMTTIFAAIIYFLLPTQFINYLKLYFSSIGFFSNIYYYLNSGYFDSSSQFNILLHTWSLSVEWQFYMIYPLILLIVKKIYLNNLKLFRGIFIAIIALSIVSMIFHSSFDKSFSFYIFYPRAWEMMIGGLAFLFENKAKNINRNLKFGLVSFSLIMITYMVYSVNEHSWPSLLTLIPVSLTSLILLLNIDVKIFRNKLIKFFGDISYSLYLWHWPIYVCSLFFGLNDRLRYRVAFIFISIIFATLSYFLIEKKNYNRKSNVILITTLVLFSLSFSLSKLNPKYLFEKSEAKLVYAASEYKSSSNTYKQYSSRNRHLMHDQSLKDYKFIKPDKSKKNILLVGDSHAAMFSQTLNELINNDNYRLIQTTADASFPIINSETIYKGPKDFFNFFYKNYFPENHDKIDLVLICSFYSAYSKDDLTKKIDFTESYFKKYNTPVMYLGQTDVYPLDYPTLYYLKNTYDIEKPSDNNTAETNEFLNNKLKDKYVDLLSLKIKKVDESGEPYMFDTNHLTLYGSEQYKKILKNKIYSKISGL
ncbi:acyltransferase family protein [Chryseobacterium luquanense]|uniref:Acyltransferase n=1 Tax=Chryseobacterium luquanense TaxID=2983766 RepID=A0ABT3Y4K7_9FLAO|nr:acyltransferase family protein [Chryseobacterium luquanense]MCX8533085.1 acyltransferase [Chryseobacterium luquanense]